MFDIINFVPSKKEGSVLGTAILRIEQEQLNIEVTVIKAKNGSTFIALPQRTYQGNDGTTKYYPLVKFDEEVRIVKQNKMIDGYKSLMGIDYQPKSSQPKIQHKQESFDDQIPF